MVLPVKWDGRKRLEGGTDETVISDEAICKLFTEVLHLSKAKVIDQDKCVCDGNVKLEPVYRIFYTLGVRGSSRWCQL